MDQALKDLLERCKADDRSAQTALYRRFASKVFATALRYTDSRDEAADIAQESWVKVFRHLGKFKEFNSFEGWVRRITVNTAITHYRRNLKHRYHDDVTETLATPLDLAASKQADFTMSEIQTAMAALPKGYRTGGAAVPRRRLLPQGDCGNVGRGCEHVEKPIVSRAEATSGFPRCHVTARQSP